MDRIVIGVDISKKNFDVALYSPDKKWLNRVFANNQKGFEALLTGSGKRNLVRTGLPWKLQGAMGKN